MYRHGAAEVISKETSLQLIYQIQYRVAVMLSSQFLSGKNLKQ